MTKEPKPHINQTNNIDLEKLMRLFSVKWPKVKNSGTNARTTQKYIHTTMDHLTKDDRESAKTEEKHEQRREV